MQRSLAREQTSLFESSGSIDLDTAFESSFSSFFTHAYTYMFEISSLQCCTFPFRNNKKLIVFLAILNTHSFINIVFKRLFIVFEGGCFLTIVLAYPMTQDKSIRRTRIQSISFSRCLERNKLRRMKLQVLKLVCRLSSTRSFVAKRNGTVAIFKAKHGIPGREKLREKTIEN